MLLGVTNLGAKVLQRLPTEEIDLLLYSFHTFAHAC